MKSIERAELLKLLAALCDGQLSETQHSRLETILLANPKARRAYLQYVDVHSRLLMHPGLAKGRKMPPGEAWAWAGLEEAVGMEGRSAAWKHRRSRWTWQRIATYVGVAAATLAATLLLQLAFYRPEPEEVAGAAVWPPEPPQYVATLAHAAGARWDEQHAALGEGSRLLPGSLKLQRGLARIHFDSGVDLLVEGPAELRLESAKSATLAGGKVVFQGESAAAPFSLRTPLSVLIDIGTEYGVVVGPQREELHVFAGAVQREPLGETPATPATESEQVASGEARWYVAHSQAAGTPTQLAPERFVRELPAHPLPPHDPQQGLLAYESFVYSNATDLKEGKGAGGSGWNGPWQFVRAVPWGMARWTLNVEAGLSRPNAPAAPNGGSFEYVGSTKYRRRLAAPLRLDADGVYYLSYLFRRDGPVSDPHNRNLVGLQFREDDDTKRQPKRHKLDKLGVHRRLSVGVDRANSLFTGLERDGSRTPLPLSYQEPYLLVAKIVASKDNPDQVFVRVYGIEEQVASEEPESWSLVGRGIRSNLSLEWVEIEIDSWQRQTLDELRLGSTWSAVAGPYVAPAAGQPAN